MGEDEEYSVMLGASIPIFLPVISANPFISIRKKDWKLVWGRYIIVWRLLGGSTTEKLH